MTAITCLLFEEVKGLTDFYSWRVMTGKQTPVPWSATLSSYCFWCAVSRATYTPQPRQSL